MSESKRDRYIYKVMTPDQWAEFQATEMFTGSPVDLEDGFIHLSCADQLKATLNKWYSEQDQVALLQVQSSEVAENLKYEVSRGGAEFPHLFSPLLMTAVRQVWLVSPAQGVYSLPEDLNAN